MRELTKYRLTDGRIVEIDESVARGKPYIDYALADGSEDSAERLDLALERDENEYDREFDELCDVAEEFERTHGLPPIVATFRSGFNG